MPKKFDRELEVVTIKLFAGDRAELQRYYPAPVGYNAAIRTIISHHIRRLRETENRQGVQQNVQLTNDDLDRLLGDNGVVRAAAE